MDFDSYKSAGLDRPPPRSVNDRSSDEIIQSLAVPEDKQYNPCTEAYPREEVPLGDFTRIPDWSESTIYPTTTRAISIYVPHGVGQADRKPGLAFFNDGDGYLWRQGPVRATTVLDNLIHDHDVPPVVAVFVNPGASADIPDQRSIEYDTVSARFVEFIDTEILPVVQSKIGLSIDPDPSMRLICGISSGGICAFNAAWHSPDSFGLVLSHCGSFTNIRGGHNFPSMIRRTPCKQIRVMLQSGKRDANIVPGSWPIANQDVAAALEFAGYEYRFAFGEGGHSLRHGGAIFADSLRWLFRNSSKA